MSVISDFFRVTPKKRSIKLKQKQGVLYSNPSGWKRGLFHIGTGLLFISLTYLVYLYYPLGTALASYLAYTTQSSNQVPPVTTVPTIAPTSPPTEIATPTPTTTPIPVIPEYSIEIPKIQAKADIITDVDPYDRNLYLNVLKKNVVAQSSTSNMAGGGNGSSSYIFAHSTEQGINMVRKNAVFYLIGQLKNGDEVIINHNQRLYKYAVYKQLVVNASQTEYLLYSEPDKEVLILQTCWPIGTDWKRLLVFGQRVD